MENIFKVNQRRPTFFFFIPVNAAILPTAKMIRARQSQAAAGWLIN
jgi:hypothetical protein